MAGELPGGLEHISSQEFSPVPHATLSRGSYSTRKAKIMMGKERGRRKLEGGRTVAASKLFAKPFCTERMLGRDFQTYGRLTSFQGEKKRLSDNSVDSFMY